MAISATTHLPGSPPILRTRLIGAADALDARTGSAMWPADRVIADWHLARLEAAPDTGAIAALRQSGAAMTLGEERAADIWRSTGVRAPEVAGAALIANLSRVEAAGATVADYGHLTRRQREVLELMCQRLTDPEIAERLLIGRHKADTLVANVLRKLGVTSQREAVAAATRHGIV